MYSNYAIYRSQIKELNRNFSEKDIYKWYVDMSEEGRIVRNTPFVGKDGQYHKLYLTDFQKSFKFYVGRHSSKELIDDYYGSGIDVKDGSGTENEHKTTVLEYFDSIQDLIAAEKRIVNPAFLTCPFVLNHIEGGDGTTPLIPNKPTAGSCDGKTRGWPFPSLDIPIGGILTFVDDETKTCRVVADWKVNYNGDILYLKDVIFRICGYAKYSNPLNAFKYNGILLSCIRDSIRAAW